MPRPVLLLLVWTTFVWGGRIFLADGALGATVLAGSFLVACALVALRRADRLSVLLLAVLTNAVWAARIVDIALLSDHEVGFVVVHGVLAAVSVGLALASLRAVGYRPLHARP